MWRICISTLGLKGLIERLNRGVTIFGDFPKRPPSVSERKFDLRILGRGLRRVRLSVTVERTQTGPPTLSNVKINHET